MRHALTTLALLTGCAAGPDHVIPDAAVPAHWSTDAASSTPGAATGTPGHPAEPRRPPGRAARPADEAPRGAWWTVFGDPLLDQLAPQVAESNQTVQAALAAHEQAEALVRQARAAWSPTFGITDSLSRSRSALAQAGAVSSGSLQGTASWIPDLWGKVRRQVEQARASADSSRAQLAATTLAQQVLLANAVLGLRYADAQATLLDRLLVSYQRSVDVTRNQVRFGIVAPSDAISARLQRENAESARIALGVARGSYLHAIAVLVGTPPGTVDALVTPAPMPQLPRVAAGVPSDLLERRPDVAAQERAVAAANAAIGVATTAWYPTLSLTGAAGRGASPLHSLFDLPVTLWSLGASAAATVFDGGLRRAGVDAARAGRAVAIANYRATVLAALQAVEDDLSALRVLQRQAAVLDAAVVDARDNARIAMNRYRAGTVDFTTVVTAQAQEQSTEQSALSVRQQRLLTTVSLIAALGGGWQAPAGSSVEPVARYR